MQPDTEGTRSRSSEEGLRSGQRICRDVVFVFLERGNSDLPSAVLEMGSEAKKSSPLPTKALSPNGIRPASAPIPSPSPDPTPRTPSLLILLT